MTPLTTRNTIDSNMLNDYQDRSSEFSEIQETLNVLLEAQKEEKKNLFKAFVKYQEKFLIPFLEQLKMTRLTTQQEDLVEIVINNIKATTNNLKINLPTNIVNQLTFIELKVATMIAHGKSTMEIADIMNLSPSTIGSHRNNIRQKLNLVKKGVSLKEYLHQFFN